MTKQEPKPHGLICYWKYVKPRRKHPDDCQLWKLVECYTIDKRHCPIGKQQHTKGTEHYAWKGWLTKYNRQGIAVADHMGRAVTSWSFIRGLELRGFSPPEFVPWLSPLFYMHLTCGKDWINHLAGSGALYYGTVEKIRDLFGFEYE